MHDLLGWSGWTELTVLAAGTGLIGCLAFMIQYHRLTRGAWRDEPEGQWMLYGRAILAAFLVLVLVNRAFPDWTGRRAATFALMALFAAQTFWPLVLVNRAHRGHSHERIKR